jgi:hypothetical protein
MIDVISEKGSAHQFKEPLNDLGQRAVGGCGRADLRNRDGSRLDPVACVANAHELRLADLSRVLAS